MVNYQKGKIYKIVCHTTGKCYIGSTTKEYLSQRLTKHVSNYKCYLKTGNKGMTSVEVLENNNFEIMLLELYPCSSKDELHARERYYCQLIECVNKVKNQGLLAELGQKEYDKQQSKAYREKNRDMIFAKKKDYREKNKEAIAMKKKDDRIQNPEKHKERYKKNYQKNKEIINEKRKQTYTCQCGSCLRISDKAQHERTKKHQDYLKSLETVEIP